MSRKTMRACFALGSLFLAVLATAGEPPPGWHQDIPAGPAYIEGVPVSGRLDSVSVADVLQAVTALRDIDVKSSGLTVVSKDEMHGYGANRDLGWFTVKRMRCVWTDRTEHPCWEASGQGLAELTGALDCINRAQQVYVFPVATPLDPHRDDAHIRLLDSRASSELKAVLAPADHWFVGFNDLMYPETEKKNVGFIFRDGKDEVVLFVRHSDVLVGTFNGEHLSGTLELNKTLKLEEALAEWASKYAQPELGS